MVEQRVVALAAMPDGVRLLAPELEQPLEGGGEASEGAVGAGLAPGLEPDGLGLGQGADQRLRDPDRVVALAAEDTQHRPGLGDRARSRSARSSQSPTSGATSRWW